MVVVLVVLLIITLILGIYWKYEEKERNEQRANYPQARCNISIVYNNGKYICEKNAKILSFKDHNLACKNFS